MSIINPFCLSIHKKGVDRVHILRTVKIFFFILKDLQLIATQKKGSKTIKYV
jgi:hypothetical protein